MTRYTATELRKMADDYDLSACDYGFDVRVSQAMRQAADDAEFREFWQSSSDAARKENA
jgi:hypothetical protein